MNADSVFTELEKWEEISKCNIDRCVLPPHPTLTDVHSLAQTNELLSYVSYESVTWVHCVPFPISSFTDKNIASIFSGALALKEQWRTYRRTHVCVHAFKKKIHTQGYLHAHHQDESRKWLFSISTSEKLQKKKKPRTLFPVISASAHQTVLASLTRLNHGLVFWHVSLLGCAVNSPQWFSAPLITIEDSQYGSTDGSVRSVHKCIC